MDVVFGESPNIRNARERASKDEEPPFRDALALFPDPLDADQAGDQIIITTRRAIARVALVATEAATRFQREALEHDPMAWLLAPRRVFGGEAAVDACLDRDACLRGVVLHGLGLGLDAERPAVDALLASEEDDFEAHEYRYLFGEASNRGARKGKWHPGRIARVRLYTATILDTRDNRMVQVFHASLARDATEVRTRLAGRFGPDVADLADIRLGIHTAAPPVIALVPQAVIELIRRMERDCAKPHARTFAVDIEMGIQA